MQSRLEYHYRPITVDPEAFKANSKSDPSRGLSGSAWGLKQIQQCRLDFQSGMEALELLKSQDLLLREDGIVTAHLREHLSTDWLAILTSCAAGRVHARQALSDLDHGLGRLASLTGSAHFYDSSSSLEPQSSPLTNRTPSIASLEGQQNTQRATGSTQTPTRPSGSLIWTSPATLPMSPLGGYFNSDLSPAQGQGKGDVSTDWQTPLPTSPPRMRAPFTSLSPPPRFAMSAQPGHLRTLSRSSLISEIDVDETASQSSYAQDSVNWNPQPNLPIHKPAPEQRNFEDKYEEMTSPPNPKLVTDSSSSSSIGDHKSPSAMSNASLASKYNVGLESVSDEDHPESSVDSVTRLFIKVVIDGMLAAASSPKGRKSEEWEIEDRIGQKNSDKFEINGFTISANPDCTINLSVNDVQNSRVRDVFLHLEAKRLNHSLSDHQILGQELSELLAEAMRFRDCIHRDLTIILSWLVSWHHLECYFSKLEVTRGYLSHLSDTSRLSKQKPPLLRRSRRYNLRIPADRVEAGLMCARILLELLAEYNSTRKLGVIEQLRS